MGNLSVFCARMAYWCNDANLGYGQDTRLHLWPGGAADCSSLVEKALSEAGFDTGASVAGVFWTGNLRSLLCARGWVALAPDGNPRPGDILLAEGRHVAVYIGTNAVAEAWINELDSTTGGADGDQTGEETRVIPYYNYPWTHYLRYQGATTDNISSEGDDELNSEQAKQLANVHYLVTNNHAGALSRLDIARAKTENAHNKIIAGQAQIMATIKGLEAAIKALAESKPNVDSKEIISAVNASVAEAMKDVEIVLSTKKEENK